MAEINWGAVGAVLLSLATLVGSFLTAKVAAKGDKQAASVAAQPSLAADTTAQVKLLLDRYAQEINDLKEAVARQDRKIEELQAILPRFRAYIHKLRAKIKELGGDPGPWPGDLE